MTLSASVDTIGKVILIRRYYGSTDVRSIRLRSRHSRTGRRLNYGGKADWLCPFLIVAGAGTDIRSRVEVLSDQVAARPIKRQRRQSSGWCSEHISAIW